jgi:hypothetical protein
VGLELGKGLGIVGLGKMRLGLELEATDIYGMKRYEEGAR